MARRLDSAPDGPYHAVQFYACDERLFTTVAGYLAEGLINGQPGLVVATAPHRAGILSHLGARLIDVDRARREGELILLDSHELLERFLRNDRIDPEAFEVVIRPLLRETLQGRPGSQLRAYGDMVNVLRTRGLANAAIGLEQLWNELASRHGFALLCGYEMDSFVGRAADLHEICDHHSHVFGPDHLSTFVRPTAH